MAFDGTGKIYVPSEEFWVFILKQIPLEDPFLPCKPRVVDQETLEISVVAEGNPDKVVETQQIGMETFWAFVEQWHPFATVGAEYCFGVPKFGDYDVEIEYAVSTTCHPMSWPIPPTFMERSGGRQKNE